MIDRSHCLSAALSLWLAGLPVASLAHEGHEHPQSGQTAGAQAGDPNASSQSQDDAARDAEAERAAKRRQKADEDAAKAKAATPTPVAPRSDAGQH